MTETHKPYVGTWVCSECEHESANEHDPCLCDDDDTTLRDELVKANRQLARNREKVATAILDARFLAGTHAIQFTSTTPRPNREVAPYDIVQVTAVEDDRPFLLYRRRGAFRSKMRRMGEVMPPSVPTTLEDPWPSWGITRGNVTDHQGHYGLWLPHLPDLLAECVIVPLADEDRPRSKR